MTKRELAEKYRQALMGLRFLAGATDDLLVHEILDETFECIGESKEMPADIQRAIEKHQPGNRSNDVT